MLKIWKFGRYLLKWRCHCMSWRKRKQLLKYNFPECWISAVIWSFAARIWLFFPLSWCFELAQNLQSENIPIAAVSRTVFCCVDTRGSQSSMKVKRVERQSGSKVFCKFNKKILIQKLFFSTMHIYRYKKFYSDFFWVDFRSNFSLFRFIIQKIRPRIKNWKISNKWLKSFIKSAHVKRLYLDCSVT